VGQVAAFGQAHAHDRVARLGEGHQHGLVGLRTGVRLDVGGFGAEQLLQAVDGQLLGDVDVLAATVVALARIAFGVLVGQLRALRFHDRLADVVFGGDQFDVLFLTRFSASMAFQSSGINFCQGVFRGKHDARFRPRIR
jgi:hypothetical protein